MPRQYKPGITRPCRQCDKPFKTCLSVLRRGKGIYCSKTCYGLANRRSLEEAFARGRGASTETGCVLWTGHRFQTGYGGLCHTRDGESTKYLYAHRVAWELARGPIQRDLFVCHRCDNRLCVNVEHLFLGTQKDNLQDMVAKGRSCCGARNGQSKLSDEKVREIREKYAAGGLTQAELAVQYGVHRTAISKIVTRNDWKHVVQ